MTAASERKIDAARAELLYRNGRHSNLTVLVAGILLAILFGRAGLGATALAWLSAMALGVGARLLLLVWRARAGESADPQAWIRRYTFVTGLLGIGWAVGVGIGWTDDTWMRMLMLLVATAVVALAVPVLVPSRRATLAYTLPVLGTAATLTLGQGDLRHLIVGGVTVLFGALLLRSAANFNTQLRRSLRLGFENEALAAELGAGKEAAVALNGQLAAEIEERRLAQDALERHRTSLEQQVDQRTAELTRAMEDAQAGNRAKSEFLAVMSHELRTPLHGMLGLHALLLRTALDTTQRRYVETATASGKAMLGMVDDILEFTQLESGRTTPAEDIVTARSLVERAADAAAAAAARKGLGLEVACEGDVDTPLTCDAGRLGRVLGHLLDNAVKFSEHGRVRLAARCTVLDATTATLAFRVSDTGSGIDPALLPHLFEVFTQADSSTTRRQGGSGIGLAICRRLVERLGGTIDAASEKGVGSTFRVDIPVRRA